MQRKQKIVLLVVAALAGLALILALFYVRQRLFTRADPIILAG